MDINPQLSAFPGLEPYLLKGVRTTADCKRLGHGSFGVVDQLYFQGTLCAAKQLHGALLDPRTQGVDRIVDRFVKECRIMSSVRHPNIVQFIGLHTLPNSSYPVLVMEQLAMSLEDLLNEATEKREELPFSLKISILIDVAKGLAYLHNHSPQIIHRDLTSRNVLLTLDMQAKITDLGNALIIDSDTVAQTMTQTPGTAVYMPPEATQAQAKYDSSIDMFSYGHLALYTAIQQFPGKDILPPTFKHQVTKQLSARSEVQRREKYVHVLHKKLGEGHLLTQVIKRCLNNEPDDRPSALQVLENLESLSKATNTSAEDTYIEYQHYSRFQLIKMVQQQAHASGIDSSYSYVIPHLEDKSTEYMELVDSTPPPADKKDFTLDDSDKIKMGVPSMLVLSKSTRGGLRRKTLTRKEYTFRISQSTSSSSLVYYEEKTKGEIDLANVTDIKVSTLARTSECSFEIAVQGKENEPLKLVAPSKDVRDSWVKAITELTAPAKAENVTPSTKSKTAQLPPSPQDKTYSPKMTQNPAYSQLPPSQVATPSKAFQPQQVTQSAVGHKPANSQPQSSKSIPITTEQSRKATAVPEVQGDDAELYSYIEDPEPDYSVATHPSPQRGCTAKKVETTGMVREDGYTQMRSVGHLHPGPLLKTSQLSSPESPMGVTKTLERLSRFKPDQMEHLIKMLKTTVPTNTQVDSGAPIGTAVTDTPPPRPPKPVDTQNGSSKSKMLAQSRERPSQLSLTTSETNSYDGQESASVYVNTIPLASEEGTTTKEPVATKEAVVTEEALAEKEAEGSTVPTLVVHSEPTNTDLAQPVHRKISQGLLTTAENTNAIKFKLARLLSETEGKSNTALLVTGDSPEAYEERPDWAKASTGTTPVHSPLPKEDNLAWLRQKALFIQKSDLHNLSEIGEGQFGKVYKALLVRGGQDRMGVAVKTIKRYKSEQATSDFLHEMGVMMNLMHPNIIHLYGIVQQESPWLVLQYLPNGDLKKYLMKNKRSVDQLVNYMIDVAMGMHYIMERGLVHRDLAARNVMVDSRETCKVADFGLLREIPKDNSIYQATTEMPWPIRWMAPESLDNREFSPASDVWSFGVLLWEMYYSNQLPYAELTNIQIPSKISSGYRLSIPSSYPDTVASIMKACWQKKPEKRPSFLLISTLLTNMSFNVQVES